MEEKRPDSMETMPETDELAKHIEEGAKQLGDENVILEKLPPQPGAPIHDLVGRFIYHPPSTRGVDKHHALGLDCIKLAQLIDAVCPAGREKSLAFTYLEIAKFWASAAVARNPETR